MLLKGDTSKMLPTPTLTPTPAPVSVTAITEHEYYAQLDSRYTMRYPKVTKVLLIGEMPNKRGQTLWETKSGTRILSLVPELRHPSYFRLYHVNLFDEYTPKTSLSLDAWRKAARFVHREFCEEYTAFVLLGENVRRAFKVPKSGPWLSWYTVKYRGTSKYTSLQNVLLLPHPSGLTRWWNDPENVRAAKLEFMRVATS